MSQNLQKPRPQKSYFPSSKCNSTANNLFQFRMSKRNLSALTNTPTITKQPRIKRIHGRQIALSGGGIPTHSAQTLGSMDRLARLKAAAINKSS